MRMHKSKILFLLAILLGALPLAYVGFHAMFVEEVQEAMPPPTMAVPVQEPPSLDVAEVLETQARLKAALDKVQKDAIKRKRQYLIDKRQHEAAVQLAEKRGYETMAVESEETMSGGSVPDQQVQSAGEIPEEIVEDIPPEPVLPPDNTAQIEALKKQIEELNQMVAEARAAPTPPPTEVVVAPPIAPVAEKKQSTVDVVNSWMGVVATINGMLLMWAGIWMKGRENKAPEPETVHCALPEQHEYVHEEKSDKTLTQKIRSIVIPNDG